MPAQEGRKSELPRNARVAEELRAGGSLADIAARSGVGVEQIQIRLSNAGWGRDGHPNHKAHPARVQLLVQWPPWVERAVCAQTDPEAFFPEKGGSTREAKAVCERCPVAAECADYAMANDERFGIWGGLSERERRRINHALRTPGEPA